MPIPGRLETTARFHSVLLWFHEIILSLPLSRSLSPFFPSLLHSLHWLARLTHCTHSLHSFTTLTQYTHSLHSFTTLTPYTHSLHSLTIFSTLPRLTHYTHSLNSLITPTTLTHSTHYTRNTHSILTTAARSLAHSLVFSINQPASNRLDNRSQHCFAIRTLIC